MGKISVITDNNINVKLIGLEKNIRAFPSDIIKALLKLFSTIGPSIIPKIIGDIGNFAFIIKYPIMELTSTTTKSIILLLIANEPKTHKTNIKGVNIYLGTFVTFTENFIPNNPNISINIFAINKPIKIIYT